MGWAEPKNKVDCSDGMKTETEAMRLEFIKAATADVRKAITGHPLYSGIANLQGVQKMMEHHVYAVWDFMSLLKALQAKLTCVHVPWFPQGNADTRFFINEIVLGEESDVDPDGGHISHFELYLKAMKQAGADTSGIERFLDALRSGASLESAFELAQTPEEVRNFVRYTLDVAKNAPVHVLAAVFTFGREDLIPDMFMELIREIKNRHPEQLDLFNYYLERHIEVDGDHHGPLSWNMVQALCGDEDARWQEAATASVQALQHRKALWDAVLHRL
jgi:hypothetical protein